MTRILDFLIMHPDICESMIIFLSSFMIVGKRYRADTKHVNWKVFCVKVTKQYQNEIVFNIYIYMDQEHKNH